MPPAIIAAAVGAAATIGGAVLSSSSQKKAANRAAESSQQNTQANNALALNIYGQNKDLLSPYNARGNEAGNAINALLGLGGSQAPLQQQPMGYGGGQNALAASGGPYGGFATPEGEWMPADLWAGGNSPQMPVNAMNMQYGQPQPVAGTVNAQPPAASGASPYQDAFKNFLGSTGFQFQMDQGNKAANQGYAARGMLQSGAALKGLQDRGQQTALNNYFLPYMNLLGQQQGVGLSGASAVAGVGQNYANSVINSNNLNSQVQLDSIAARSAANQQLYAGIGNAVGGLAGGFMGSSYRPF